MEEADDALLRRIEEGSGHGVVLSISTEKLRGKKRELEVADPGCPGAGKAARLRGTCAGEEAALVSKHTNTALGSPALPAVEGIDSKVQCHKTQQGLVSLLNPQPLPRLRVPPTLGGCSPASPTCRGYATVLPWMGWQSLEQ